MVIDPAFKADAPARCARLRELGPVHPAEFHLGLRGWVVVGHDLAREALTHPALLKDATPAAEVRRPGRGAYTPRTSKAAARPGRPVVPEHGVFASASSRFGVVAAPHGTGRSGDGCCRGRRSPVKMVM
ncbi:hypothetical protein ABZ307_11590 [Streptomyces griseorubiginosus]|uniref:hypothetical protein n=1 Tax=Streptomyces griseorubiginosus TaxID=67304 RepID=UPI0033AA5EA2